MAYNGPLPQVVKAGGTGDATLTAHGVLIGNGLSAVAVTSVGSTGQVLQGNTGADPTYSTATYPSTTTVSELLYSSASNTVSGLATANRGVLTTGTTGVPVITALATDGQLIIGSTAGAPAAATLSAGTGISITNGSNSITVAVASGTSVVQTLTGNTGGAISPTAGDIGTVGTGSITIAGAGSTLTTQLTGLTNHNVLVGAGTATITNVAPSATSGVPLISQGAAADPAFGTAVVGGGGTGATSFTAYGVVLGGTTSTGALQSVTPSATTTAILTSGGSSAVAAWKNLSVVVQTFTGDGTYTPTSGMVYCIIEAVGGGGGGGSSPSTSGSQVAVGTGGGGGEYARGVFSAATIGASKSVTIGTAGTAGSGGSGGTGGTTTVGATTISAVGGTGGSQISAQTNATAGQGGAGGTGGTGGSFRVAGTPGGNGTAAGGAVSFPWASGGNGGSTFFGGGGQGAVNVNNGGGTTGGTATGYGGGGGGAASTAGSGAHNGGAGSAGIVVVTEYVIS